MLDNLNNLLDISKIRLNFMKSLKIAPKRIQICVKLRHRQKMCGALRALGMASPGRRRDWPRIWIFLIPKSKNPQWSGSDTICSIFN